MTTVIDGISFDTLLKARERFEQFRKNLHSDQEKAGAIKAFEYTYESVWKNMKRLVDIRGGVPFSINGSRDVFRAAAHINIDSRSKNMVQIYRSKKYYFAYTYNEEDADTVIAIFNDFSRELTLFLKNIGIVP